MPKHLAASLFLIISLLVISGCLDESMQPVSDINDKQSDAENIEKIDKDSSTLKVHYIDVGQADATLLEFSHEGEAFTILIDTGDWNAADVVNYLTLQNIDDIDIVAITHPHADHIGQLDKIIDAFNVTEVWMNGEIANSQVFAKSLEAIEKNEIDYYEPEVGEIFDIGPLQIEILHPASLSSNTNNNSLVMRMLYDDVSFLFTGDAEQQAENEILASGADISAQILQLGHHGSKTSSTPNFVQAVNPEVAIYSAGEGNSYNHPDAEVIDLINANNIKLYGTDQQGTIIVETDGKNYQVTTDKQAILPDNSTNEACVNINTASEEEVQQITHIGAALAAELIKLRPYHSLDELIEINGIGEARLLEIKEQGIACLGG